MKLIDRQFKFNRDKMISLTKENPFWIHFGCGNIFRAFPAACAQRLLDEGIIDRGIIAVEGFDDEIVEKVYLPHNNISLLVTLKSNGCTEKTVIGSVAEALTFKDFERAAELFSKPSLQMATFTITEKGYLSENYMSRITQMLYRRYKSGASPIAMVSMDNCSHNGDKLKNAVYKSAEKYNDLDFINYLNRISFPWTMIDKITPRPDSGQAALLQAEGWEDAAPILTRKNTFIAPFVNAEDCEYLVIEDDFPNGRPPLEKSGIIFTDRITVDRCEKMKVCACLNPVHTALAIFGCLMGYNSISDEMKDDDLRLLAEYTGREGLAVIEAPKVIRPEDFFRDVLNVRLPNPFLPDSPQRIATDTSQKLSVRYGETIKKYGEKAKELKFIPLVIAAWLRYLSGVDDYGISFELSPDPLLDELSNKTNSELLKMTEIFGVDLCRLGLTDKILGYAGEFNCGIGSVRKTLKKYLSEAGA